MVEKIVFLSSLNRTSNPNLNKLGVSGFPKLNFKEL